MDKIKMGIVGLGGRGYGVLDGVILKMDDVIVTAVCDVYEDRVQQAQKAVVEHGDPEPKGFADYNELIRTADIDCLLVTTSWEYHSRVCIAGMEAGIPVATEVGCEYSMEMLDKLVNTQEKTNTPFMFLENCCYGKEELLGTSLARHGLFGQVVHCEGSYSHDIREEVAMGLETRHYRYRNYQHRNTNNYPTHCLGPIARLLNVNRGNRIVSVVAASSKAVGIEDWVKSELEKGKELPGYLKTAHFMQGDVVTALLTLAGGETITLRLDTTLPRFYTRNFTVRGTKGFYEGNTNTVFIDGVHNPSYDDPVDAYKVLLDNGKEYSEYMPAIWRNLSEEEKASGHGGMDYFVYHAFVDGVKNGTPMPIDVYDAATWLAVSVLVEKSLQLGGAPQIMPDYTSGLWFMRKPEDVVDFDQ